MRLRFIDDPQPVDRDRYAELMDRMVVRSASWGEVESVYQIGGINDPGISDIDLVVVFRDGVTCTDDPRGELEPPERYLLSHGLYGVHASDFAAAPTYTCFHNYRHLHGKRQNTGSEIVGGPRLEAIRRQIAMEYLLRMYISLAVQITYRVVKLRALLLTAKAVAYDLDFLGIMDGRLRSLIARLIRWRAAWFSKPPGWEEMSAWTVSFFAEVESLLRGLLEEVGFYSVPAERYRVAGHLYVTNCRSLSYRCCGVVLPSRLGPLFAKHWFGIQRRLNSFHFTVPIRNVEDVQALKEKMAFEDRIVRQGRQHLPRFLPLKSALSLEPQR